MGTEQDPLLDVSIDADDTAVARLSEISTLPGVRKVVGLNDLHQGKQETPTSIVTVTEGTIYPELSSNVINCGMSLIRTDLHADDVTRERISEFCRSLKRISDAYRPGRKDVVGMLGEGAEYVVDRWDCDSAVTDRIENGGSMFDAETRPSDVKDVLPPWLLRYNGIYDDTPVPSLAGNHFIEFQAVDKVLDVDTAAEFDLSEDQVVILLHGDYTLTSILNWHHANRLKFRERISLLDRLKLQGSKVAFHLLRDGPTNFPRNWRLYDNRGRYTAFDIDSVEGEHLVSVIYAAMNFAYANRLLLSLAIRDALHDVMPERREAELFWDVGHDTIQRETHNGKEYWVHRKGAAKSIPGKPAIVSGSYDMNSFLGVGGQDGERFFRSYDHGCSHVIEHFERKSHGGDHATMMFDAEDGTLRDTVHHRNPGPIETVVKNLQRDGVVSGVAWLRPVANIAE